MKLKVLTLLTLSALAVVLCFSAATSASPRTPAAIPAANPQPAAAAAPAAAPEPHPEIRQALGALRRAKAHMEMAAHDFGGHRVDALKATDEAIRQLEICLKFDKE